MKRLLVLLTITATPALAQHDTTATRDALMKADQALAERVRTSAAAAFLEALEPRAVVLFGGTPTTTGAAGARAPYLARYGPPASFSWRPAHAIVSSDGAFGCTTGFVSYTVPSDSVPGARGGSYITCWRRGTDGAWRIVGHQRAEDRPGTPPLGSDITYATAPHSATQPSGAEGLREAQDADAAFAKMGSEPAGPGPAFAKYVAADGIFPGSVPPTRGPEGMRNAFAQFPSDRVLWWEPDRNAGFASGGLAFTIGNSITRLRSGEREFARSHYLSVWRKEPDGRWAWVVDLGSPLPHRTSP